MPETRYFEVSQTRKVKVTANTVANAILIADAAFENGQNTDDGVRNGPNGVWGNTTSRVRTTDMTAYEEI